LFGGFAYENRDASGQAIVNYLLFTNKGFAMKKILALGALLAALCFVFAGCENPAAPDDDPGNGGGGPVVLTPVEEAEQFLANPDVAVVLGFSETPLSDSQLTLDTNFPTVTLPAINAYDAAIEAYEALSAKAKILVTIEKAQLDAVKTRLDPIINLITSVSITDTPPFSVGLGGALIFHATTVYGSATNLIRDVKWSVNGTSADTKIAYSSLYVGVLYVGADETESSLTVTATSVVNKAKFASVTVTVSGASTLTGITISGSSETVRGANKVLNITASGTGNPSNAVKWTVTGQNSPDTLFRDDYSFTSESLGTTNAISPNADHRIHLSIGLDETTTSMTVTATSIADPTKSDTLIVPLAPVSVTLSVSPGTSLIKGATETALKGTFTATVAGLSNKNVYWTLAGVGATKSNYTQLLYPSSNPISIPNVLTIYVTEPAPQLKVTVKSSVAGYTDVSDEMIVDVINPYVTGVTVAPLISGATVYKGVDKSFGATVAVLGSTLDSLKTVTWSVEGNAKPETTISSIGVLSVASNESASTVIVKATSVTDGVTPGQKVVGTLSVAVDQTPVTVAKVMVTPGRVVTPKGTSVPFTATVTDSIEGASPVTWTVTGGTSTISSVGVLTVAAADDNQTLTVKAASAVNGYSAKYDEVTVIVKDPWTAANSGFWINSTSANGPNALDTNGIAYGNGKYVAVGEYGKVSHSNDGIAWTQINTSGSNNQTSPSKFMMGGNGLINGVLFADNQFITYGTQGRMAYSTDGVTWTGIALTTPTEAEPTVNNFTNSSGVGQMIYGMAYGNGKYIAVGSGVVTTSTDGRSWTKVTTPTTGFIYDIIFDGAGFYIRYGTGTIAYSTNGTSWTTKTAPFTTADGPSPNLNSIAYGGGKLVAWGYTGTSNSYTYRAKYSTDGGTTWTVAEDSTFWSTSYQLTRKCVYVDGKFVATSVLSGFLEYSPDGIDWTRVYSAAFKNGAADHTLAGIGFGNGKYLVGANTDQSGAKIAYSTTLE
jgi:hypothetical protein